MLKRGRPRGVRLNPAAVEDLLQIRQLHQVELADAGGVTPGHLVDMLRRGKGASPRAIRKMAVALRCQPETIAPELTRLFVPVRFDDSLDDVLAEVTRVWNSIHGPDLEVVSG